MNIMDNPVCPLDYRYGRKELKEIFGETKRLQYLLDVEAALARAHAKVGNIPKSAANEISKKASLQRLGEQGLRISVSMIFDTPLALILSCKELTLKQSNK